jgi:hypothetical protein
MQEFVIDDGIRLAQPRMRAYVPRAGIDNTLHVRCNAPQSLCDRACVRVCV